MTVSRRVIEVKGRAASVYGLTQMNGTAGLMLDPGSRFAVTLANQLDQPTLIHWHGQTPAPDQDGVEATGYVEAIAPGGAALNGTAVTGALRDTVLVPALGAVTISLTTDNPGRWLLHCHNLFHMATGMMTELVYAGA